MPNKRRTCKLCGERCKTSTGICTRATCVKDHDRSRRRVKTRKLGEACKRCGEPCGTSNKTGICSRSSCVKYQTQVSPWFRKQRDLCRLAGALPQRKSVQHLNGNWRGGRVCVCAVCGVSVGWQRPSVIRTRRVGFRCPAHKYVKLHTQAKGADSPSWRGGRTLCYCIVCGTDIGFKHPSTVHNNKTGLRCPEHRYSRLPNKENANESKQVRSHVA